MVPTPSVAVGVALTWDDADFYGCAADPPAGRDSGGAALSRPS
ncbi:MAG TPA: hypothetical protein VMA72_18370 [Streptosporangiaceae bacterium]|nr:hypothetical protein [Streptosporangiaceae bacterium]